MWELAEGWSRLGFELQLAAGVALGHATIGRIGSEHRWHLQKIYTISAVIAGIAGALLTQTTNTVALEVLSFQRSADVVVC